MRKLLLLIAFVSAARGATIVAASGGGNWNSTGTWVGGVVPTQTDDVQLKSTSGNVTITANASARSLDLTGYTGTLTHNGGQVLFLGDSGGSCGPGNVILKFPVSGFTYTHNTTGSLVGYESACGTPQTIDWGQEASNLAPQYFQVAGGSYKLLSDLNLVQSTAAGFNLTAGTLDLNGHTITTDGVHASNAGSARGLVMNGGTIDVIGVNSPDGWDVTDATGFSISGSGTIKLERTLNAANFISGTGGGPVIAYPTVILYNQFAGSGGGGLTVAAGTTFANLQMENLIGGSAAVQTINSNITVTGTFSLLGTANAITLNSDSPGTHRTITAGAYTHTNSSTSGDITVTIGGTTKIRHHVTGGN